MIVLSRQLFATAFAVTLLFAASAEPALAAPSTPLPPATDVASEARLPVQWDAVAVPAAERRDLQSTINGHRYRIFVAPPPGPVPVEGYPVLYVLDGNAAFPVAALLSRTIASRRDATGLVPPLVVGIGYPGDGDFDVAARRRDYTVGTGTADPSAVEGGAALMLDFIERELKPMIAARYRIDTQRQALFGHSFGGLFALHALFTRPQAFSTYLVSSPSIWWQDKVILNDLPQLTSVAATGLPRVQISVGSLEDRPRKGAKPELQAVLAKRPMVAEARELAERLRALPGGGDRVVYHELIDEDHGFSWMPAMTRGLQFFLERH